ncbi:20257_t:CDS:2, partial [Gigaspora margarita]
MSNDFYQMNEPQIVTEVARVKSDESAKYWHFLIFTRDTVENQEIGTCHVVTKLYLVTFDINLH